MPPTETKGRVHTSTVTVSVTDTNAQTDDRYDMISNDDFRIEWFSGQGAGGQHRNKKQNSCRVIHTPTGLMEARQGRKRESNLREAKEALLKTLQQKKYNDSNDAISQERKQQAGSGMRGDKIRTYRFQEDRVTDHQTGRTKSIKRVMRGNMNVFWE